jgi:hypothetical integral membrane protein (TIGR02206 family)
MIRLPSEFAPFTPLHVVVAGVCIAAMAGACVLGLRWRGTRREHRYRLWWCVFVLAWQGAHIVWWLLPTNFDPAVSWPLQLCDVVAIVAPLALLTRDRRLRAVLYFWAIGLSTQAFFTPLLDHGPAHARFWFFWVGHTQIVGSAVYDVVVLGFRPRWRDYVTGTWANLAYFAVVMPVNLVFDLNYGYLGDHLPEGRTLLHDMPDWPWRLLVIAAIVQSVMAVLWLVWPLAARIRGTAPREPDGAG